MISCSHCLHPRHASYDDAFVGRAFIPENAYVTSDIPDDKWDRRARESSITQGMPDHGGVLAVRLGPFGVLFGG